MLDYARRKGWNGSLAIPRELFLLTIAYVVKALHSELADMSCFGIDEQLDGSTTLHPLGIKPISEVANWRSCSRLFQQTSSCSLNQATSSGNGYSPHRSRHGSWKPPFHSPRSVRLSASSSGIAVTFPSAAPSLSLPRPRQSLWSERLQRMHPTSTNVQNRALSRSSRSDNPPLPPVMA